MRPRTLVSLQHRHGIAEVRLSHHGASLTSDARRETGAPLQGHRPAVEGLRGEVTLSGGLLPPRAVRAVVFDRAGRENDATCGHGAWLALLDQPIYDEPPVVRFLDPADEVVSVPLPAGVRLQPVDDAIDPCPVCKALEWRKVTAAPEGRYGTDGSGRPTGALCGRCGFEEQLGVLYAAVALPSWPADEDIDDTDAEIAEREAEARQARIDAARSTPFRFYGLVAGTPVPAGLGRRNGVNTSITLDYETSDGLLAVTTETDEWLESPSRLVRGALESLTLEDHWPELSDAAVLLWLNARTRERAAEAHRAPVHEVEIVIDGESTTFTTVALHDEFAAATRLPDATILVSGSGSSDELALRTISTDELDALE